MLRPRITATIMSAKLSLRGFAMAHCLGQIPSGDGEHPACSKPLLQPLSLFTFFLYPKALDGSSTTIDPKKPSKYFDFLKTPGNRRRLLVLVTMGTGSNWVGNGIIAYYLSPALKLVGITSS